MVEKQSKHNKEIWFPAKKLGWGWGLPGVWQGWAVLLSFIIVGSGPLLYFTLVYKGDTYCRGLLNQNIAVTCDPDGMVGMYVVASVMWLTAAFFALIIISNTKGEKPSWKWNNKKVSKKHEPKS